MSLRVLLLEDDELVRRLFSRYLRSRGCIVRDVSAVSEALELLPDFQPQVILTDVMLIGETGLNLFHALPPLMQQHVVFMTGYSGFAREGLKETGCPVLYKPFPLDELWSVLLLTASD
jgi:CheY-like chemotaxis protein